MRPDAGDKLYFPLERTYRPRATRPQVLLVVLAVALAVSVVVAHYYLVVRSWPKDVALASMAYEPWYLSHEEAVAVPQGTAASASPVPSGRAGLPPDVLLPQSVNPVRPNLVPQPGVSYSPSELTGKIEAYLESKGAGASKGDVAAKAQELADAYASSTGAGVSAFPFPADVERSVLERGWLWDVREGCEPQLYLKFPPGQLDAMGCALAPVPAGKPFGVGVALVKKEGTGQRPVIAVVWENK